MEFLTNFIDSFTSIIQSVWNFFSGIVNNVVMLGKYIGLAATTAYNLIASLPTWLQAIASATILIAILYMILGREAGGDSD